MSQAQLRCVTTCQGRASIIRGADNVRDCCISSNGGGYVKAGSSACTSCAAFKGAVTSQYIGAGREELMQCLFTAVDPRISFEFDPDMPVVGERFTAVCSANFSASVPGQIMLEWRDEMGQVIDSSSGNNNVDTEFTIEEFTFADSSKIGGYQCWATVITADHGNVTLCQNILFTCEF